MMRKDKLSRINKSFEKDFRDAALMRIKNEVDKEVRSMPELTKMAKNCPSFPNLMRELSTTKRKEDLR